MDLENTPSAFFTKERLETIGNNCAQKIGLSSSTPEGINPAAVRLDLPHLQSKCTLIYTSTPFNSNVPSLNPSTHSFEYAIHEKPSLPRAYEPTIKKQVKIAVIQHEESALSSESENKDLDQSELTSKTPFVRLKEEEDSNESDTCDSPSSRDHSPSNKGRSGSKGTCMMGHELKDERPENCKTCVKRIVSLKKFASKHKGRLISQKYTEKLIFECEAAHVWTCSYKSARKRWCPHCRKDEKVQRINEKEQMIKERENQNRLLQEELFAKARIQAQKEAPKPTEFVKQQQHQPNLHPSPLVIQAQQNLAVIETQTEQYARVFAGEFMKKSTSDCTFDQAFMVYKLLFVADKYFQLLSIVKNQDEIKAFYRNTLRLLHPDKNKHPDSAKTFQKVHNHYKLYTEKHKI